MQIKIPKQVAEILSRLREHGFEAYAVGGCVRDTLLNREPEDWDITTSAKPEAVKSIFGKTIDTGLKHGTVTVMREHVGYEITTYRVDGEYEDGRHPSEVSFTGDLKEDLCRRDFTINAMAYSPETGVVDIFGGMEDLKNGLIRCVGTASERFTEDALRILRAIRFSAQLGFEIEEHTYQALSEIAPNLAHVSKERVQVELTKTLLSSHPERIFLAEKTQMVPYISDSCSAVMEAWERLGNQKREEGFREYRMKTSSLLKPEKAVRWSAFLAPVDEKQAEIVLKELKMDHDTIHQVTTLVDWLLKPLSIEPAFLRRVMSQMNDELFDELLNLKEWIEPETADDLKKIRKTRNQIREQNDCIQMKNLAVTGHDLIKLGIQPGPELGEQLKELFELVLEKPECNKKEELLRRAAKKHSL